MKIDDVYARIAVLLFLEGPKKFCSLSEFFLSCPVNIVPVECCPTNRGNAEWLRPRIATSLALEEINAFAEVGSELASGPMW